MIGKGLNKVVGKDKITYLYANSGVVQLLAGVATNLVDFRTPNAASKIEFELFIDAQLTYRLQTNNRRGFYRSN